MLFFAFHSDEKKVTPASYIAIERYHSPSLLSVCLGIDVRSSSDRMMGAHTSLSALAIRADGTTDGRLEGPL